MQYCGTWLVFVVLDIHCGSERRQLPLRICVNCMEDCNLALPSMCSIVVVCWPLLFMAYFAEKIGQ